MGARKGRNLPDEMKIASSKSDGKFEAVRKDDGTSQGQRRSVVMRKTIFGIDIVGLLIGPILVIGQLVGVIGVVRVNSRLGRQLLMTCKMCTPRHIGRHKREGDEKGEDLAEHGRTPSGFTAA